MNLSDIAIIFGICTPLVIGGGTAGKYYADHEYVTIASQNQSLLWDIEDEMTGIQERIDNGTATASDLARMATLKERQRQLSK